MDSRGCRAVSPLTGKTQGVGPARSEDEAVPTAFEVFPDGSLLELVRDPSDPGALRLLHWNGQTAIQVHQIELEGQIFVPPKITRSKLEAVCLPSGIQRCGPPREILNDIAEVISNFVELLEGELRLVSAYALYSWLPDRLPVAPYLWLVGPLGSGKTTLLRLLSCLCRRAVLIGDVSQASLYLLVNELNPTLLLDEMECDHGKASRALQRLLRAGSTKDVSVARKGELYRAFGAKILASRQPPADAALASRALFIRMAPTRRDLPSLTTEAMAKIAEDFQNRLLDFRLANYRRVLDAQFPQVTCLTPRIRDFARALAAPMQGDPELAEELVEILAEEDQSARLERSLEPEWLAAEALFNLCHERAVRWGQNVYKTVIFVGGVAQQINKTLERWGADKRYHPRAVGPVLRSIGIRTKKFGRWGIGVELNLTFRRKIHELARQYDIDRRDIAPWTAIEVGAGGAACLLCEEFGLAGGLRLVEMKEPSPSRYRGPRRAAEKIPQIESEIASK